MAHAIRRRRSVHTSDVNMTSLLDVVFIMLIFFIVTATFVHETGILPNVSRNNHPPQVTRPDEPIGFRIDANNRIFYANRLIDNWSIEPIIKAESTARPEAPVVIQTSPDAHTAMVVRIYDEALKAGMPRDRVAVTVE